LILNNLSPDEQNIMLPIPLNENVKQDLLGKNLSINQKEKSLLMQPYGYLWIKIIANN